MSAEWEGMPPQLAPGLCCNIHTNGRFLMISRKSKTFLKGQAKWRKFLWCFGYNCPKF